MEVTKQPTNSNDYAVARELNLLAMGMIMNIYLADNAGLSPNKDIQEINRAYILLVDELQRLYDNNHKLASIEPEPIWKRFDVLKHSTQQVIKHISSESDYGGGHYARVEKLCILANVETPKFTPKQKKLVDYVNRVTDKYYEMIDDAYDRKRAKETNPTQTTKEDGGQIAKLSLVQKSLKLNVDGVTYTLKRFDSTKRFNYKLAKFLLDRPDKWVSQNDLEHFKMRSKAKDWPKLMGFTGELKDIFIDVDTKEQKIMLNPIKSLTADEAEILKKLVNTSK